MIVDLKPKARLRLGGLLCCLTQLPSPLAHGEGEHRVRPHGTPRRDFAAEVWLGMPSSSVVLATRAMSWPLFLGTAGEVTQNEGGAGSTSSLSPGPARGSCRRRGRLCCRHCRSRSAALPPKKTKALAEKRHEEVTMHHPHDWDLLPLREAFPGCPPIWAAPSCAPSQHPHPHPGDAGGDAWPQLERGSKEAAANTAPYRTKYHQVTCGRGVYVCPQGLDTPDWSHWK